MSFTSWSNFLMEAYVGCIFWWRREIFTLLDENSVKKQTTQHLNLHMYETLLIRFWSCLHCLVFAPQSSTRGIHWSHRSQLGHSLTRYFPNYGRPDTSRIQIIKDALNQLKQHAPNIERFQLLEFTDVSIINQPTYTFLICISFENSVNSYARYILRRENIIGYRWSIPRLKLL